MLLFNFVATGSKESYHSMGDILSQYDSFSHNIVSIEHIFRDVGVLARVGNAHAAVCVYPGLRIDLLHALYTLALLTALINAIPKQQAVIDSTVLKGIFDQLKTIESLANRVLPKQALLGPSKPIACQCLSDSKVIGPRAERGIRQWNQSGTEGTHS